MGGIVVKVRLNKISDILLMVFELEKLLYS